MRRQIKKLFFGLQKFILELRQIYGVHILISTKESVKIGGMTYGVFKTVPANPPIEPDTKLFMSCACGLYYRNDKIQIEFGAKKKV